MEMYSSSQRRLAAVLLLCFCLLLIRVHGSRKLYITYLRDRKHGHPDDVVASHHAHSQAFLEGFAAMLTKEQAKQLAELPEVISVLPSRRYETTATRSWDFLGLNYQMPSQLLHRSNYGEDSPGILISEADHIVCRSCFAVGRCTADALNGTDVRGQIVLCVSLLVSPLALFPLALKNVLNRGGSGLIFAPYTMDALFVTADCKDTVCVLVDLDTANQIGKFHWSPICSQDCRGGLEPIDCVSCKKY